MRIAITGLANSGKTTVFNALTGMRIETTAYPTKGAGSPNIGVVDVPDERVERLSGIFKPKKTTHAQVEYIDYIGLLKGDAKQNQAVFEHIKDADAIVHIVRAFRDDSVPHPMGGIDPLRDVKTVEAELLFGDFALIEKRLSSMEEAAKRGKKQDDEERKVLLKCMDALENETALRDVEFTGDELKAMRHLQFLSIKPLVTVVNIEENDLNSEYSKEVQARIEEYFKGRSPVITLSGKVEMDIAGMPPEEAKAFLEDLKIEEPALKKLIRISYGLLGLISFLTVGKDEVRAWTIKKGETALKAAGKIHSDIERGFIRAEVIAFEDFIKAGSMQEAKDRALLRLEGKTYEVKDGDLINFRFGA